MNGLPASASDVMCWRKGGSLSRGLLAYGAQSVARRLPSSRPVINLCEQRAAFITVAGAAWRQGVSLLLPPALAPGTLARLLALHPRAIVASDRDRPDCASEFLAVDELPSPHGDATNPAFHGPPPEHVAAISFTSASTGESTPHAKTWRSLESGARLAARRFGFGPDTGIVATVPAQHMYGFETTIMVPLVAGASVHDARPLFPGDVARCLAEVDTADRVLVTTPIHLKSLVEARCTWPRIDRIICATAPLLPALATAAEARLGAPVHEIFGCTEGGSLASRRTREGAPWHLYDGVRLTMRHDAAWLAGGHLEEPTAVADLLEPIDAEHFRFLGRRADHVSVAGKRASLADLNLRLLAIDGVEDGAFVAPDALDGAQAERLAAAYVSRRLSPGEVAARLAREVDAVFVPRPLRRVEALPRNEFGKLARADLLRLLDRARP